MNVAVNDLKRLAHVWGTTVPHAGPDTVYVVIQHKTPAGERARVDGGCFGFGADGRFEHAFALPPANNYRVEARTATRLVLAPSTRAPARRGRTRRQGVGAGGRRRA